MKAVFADSVYFFALLNARDIIHQRAVRFATQSANPLVTTAWIITDRVANAREGTNVQLGKLLLSARQDEKGVIHFWRASISAIARSKGMGFSPEAFAPSKARMDSNSSTSASSFW